MSTYSIAGAIEKFAKNFEEVISEKNRIEKQKLELEKEKFEFNKQRVQKLPEEKECEHDWEVTNFKMTNDDLIFLYTCRKCKETKATSMRHFLNITDTVIDVELKT